MNPMNPKVMLLATLGSYCVGYGATPILLGATATTARIVLTAVGLTLWAVSVFLHKSNNER